MTDRIKGLTVALDRDFRDDDVQAIVDAILMVRGVKSVTKSVVEMSDYTARIRVASELQSKVLEVFSKELKF